MNELRFCEHCAEAVRTLPSGYCPWCNCHTESLHPQPNHRALLFAIGVGAFGGLAFLIYFLPL